MVIIMTGILIQYGIMTLIIEEEQDLLLMVMTAA
jgi:hypothetical protein